MKDPIRFAKEAASFSGEFSLAERERLRDELADDEGVVKGSVSYRVEGAMVGGRFALRVRFDANPTLICQRCLAPYVHPLHSEGVLFLARNEAELERWENIDPLLDAIVGQEPMDVLTLVEDEFLLSLPVVPRHEEDHCPRRDDVLGEH
ncbi:MAG: YceD family protein [Pseudomonadota bacterium]|nr:YceD family protein [Pseudomonadota bacterium]MDP1904682.1 YceD family protein [Pseudomonadota bacterium]MDP2352873.1 YceD family protein [Pseudomonadota bacterium]